MKNQTIPNALSEAIRHLCKNLAQDLDLFWPAPEGKEYIEGREIHEANLTLQLAAILRPSADIYTEVSTKEVPDGRVDFVALPREEDWFLLCAAKRGYETKHITGILNDIQHMRKVCRSAAFKDLGRSYKNAYCLILVTVWEKKGRALVKAWDGQLDSGQTSDIANACRKLVWKLATLKAYREKYVVNDYRADGRHLLPYAVFKEDPDRG